MFETTDMTNEQSTVDFEGPPELLEGRDIASVAEYIKSDECKNVYLMVSRSELGSTRTVGSSLIYMYSLAQVTTRRRKLRETRPET